MSHNTATCGAAVGLSCTYACSCWCHQIVPTFDADGPEVEPLPLEPFEPDDEGD